MRLSEFEKQVILQSVRYYDPRASVYLFGSRTDDTKRGGDIDLLIISESIDFETKLKIRIAITKEIGEQKIDLLVVKNIQDDPFAELAFNTGIPL